MYPQHLGGNPLQQASGSATQSSTTSAPRAAEPTFIPVAGQEPEGSRKRQRYWEEDSTDSEEEAEFDPESYYQSTPQKMAKVVDDFIGKTFRRCLPKRKRWEMAKEYPKSSSSSAAVPNLDQDIKGALGKELPEKADAQLAKVQATVLATCAPLANFWSHLSEQEFTGKTEELIPVSDVIRVTQDTLALIGNASNYISQARRSAVISSIAKSRPKLSSFLKEICKEDLGDTGLELFGPEVRKKITQRASTIEAFNKAISKVDNPSSVPSSSSSFLSKRPAAKYGGEPGRSYTPYNKFRQHRQGYRGSKGPFRPQRKFQNFKHKAWEAKTSQ